MTPAEFQEALTYATGTNQRAARGVGREPA